MIEAAPWNTLAAAAPAPNAALGTAMLTRPLARVLCLAVALIAAAAGYTIVMARIGHGAAPGMQPPDRQADFLLVTKADKRLRLFRHGRIIGTYRIAMGAHWNRGPKRQQGDGRTPEGDYVIDWRNPHSAAYLSLHISYPDRAQRNAARGQRLDPGGDIMIHGLPNGWGFVAPIHRLLDWTDGCIAVTDAEMREIWSLVPTGTRISIRERPATLDARRPSSAHRSDPAPFGTRAST